MLIPNSGFVSHSLNALILTGCIRRVILWTMDASDLRDLELEGSEGFSRPAKKTGHAHNMTWRECPPSPSRVSRPIGKDAQRRRVATFQRPGREKSAPAFFSSSEGV
ncbi:hypothetical protein FALCPG4_003372 [Fusarium falciforme]